MAYAIGRVVGGASISQTKDKPANAHIGAVQRNERARMRKKLPRLATHARPRAEIGNAQEPALEASQRRVARQRPRMDVNTAVANIVITPPVPTCSTIRTDQTAIAEKGRNRTNEVRTISPKWRATVLSRRKY